LITREKIAKHPCRPRTCQSATADQISEDSESILIRVVAWQVFARLPQNSGVELTDLMQAGFVGLLRARETYRPDRDVLFPVYARFRIRGEILDMLRRLDGAPRSVRRWQRAVDTGSRELTARLQRIPTDEEISELLGIRLDIIRRNRQVLCAASRGTETPRGNRDDKFGKLQDWAAALDATPDAIHERKESLRALLNCVVSLPARARQVIILYYRQNMTMKQIGAVLRVNESRVSQIHKAALEQMWDGMHSAGITSPPRF
jgi:RNA polymerase sigma factor for flagellar operon FliA